MTQASRQKQVALVIGAGPTGMTLSKVLLDKHISVIMVDENTEGVGGGVRDSIYWNKDKLKLGIMKKYPEVLRHPRFRYFGGVQVGQHRDVTIAQLHEFAPIILTCGSRGVKDLPIAGSHGQGVWDANVLVRILNTRWLLGRTKGPEFEEGLEKPYVSSRVALVGMGNVVADTIGHLAMLDQREGCGRDIRVLVRRTPFANKISAPEMKGVARYLDKEHFEKEMGRIFPILLNSTDTIPEAAELKPGWENDPAIFEENLQVILKAMRIKPAQYNELPERVPEGQTRVRFNFLTQIGEVQHEGGTDAGKLTAVIINKATPDGGIRQVPTDVSTVIFSVGSAVDTALQLPKEGGWFVPDKNNPLLVEGYSDIFMAGWARQPSMGLAGIAVKEGRNAGHAIAETLEPIEDERQAQETLELVAQQVADQLVANGKSDLIDRDIACRRLEVELETQNVMSFLETQEKSSINA